MTSIQERLQQLLDGDLDPADIADDPTLVSLADRIYGIKIAPVQPVKARDFPAGGSENITEVAPPTHMLVEVIEPAAPPLQPIPTLENGALPPVPELPTTSSSPLRWAFTGAFIVSVLNLFGVFGMLFGGVCESDTLCPVDGYTRINWLSVHEINSGHGWSLTVLDGSYGIPDIVAVIGTAFLMFIFTRRK